MDTRTQIAPSPSTKPAAVHPLERAASSWLGRIAADKPELEAHWAGVDRFGHAMLASLTNGMSPASLVQASTDWALHLALAPGKQGQLECVDIYSEHTMALTRQMNEANRSASFS